MLRNLSSRLVELVLTLLGISFATFLLMSLIPGNVAQVILGNYGTPEAVAKLSREMGLDRPFLVQYGEWLGQALRGDFGSSPLSGQAVLEAVIQRIPVSLELTFLALLVAVVTSTIAATWSVRRPQGLVDRAIGVVTFAMLACPNFLLALMMILLFAGILQVLPSTGYVAFAEDPVRNLRSVLLPVLALAAAPAATYTRLLRGDMLTQLTRSGYVETARAKGLSESRIMFRHVLPNSLFPVLTMTGLTASLLLGGSVVIEGIFGIPGIGQMLVQSVGTGDVPTVLGAVVMIAVIIALISYAIEVTYALLDPRVRHERADS